MIYTICITTPTNIWPYMWLRASRLNSTAAAMSIQSVYLHPLLHDRRLTLNFYIGQVYAAMPSYLQDGL